MPVTIFWDSANSGPIGWVADRLGSLWPQGAPGARKRKSAASIAVFCTDFHAPVGAGRSLRKAVELALPQLIPLAVDDVVLFGKSVTGGARLAAVRRRDLEAGQAQGQRRLILEEGWIAPTPQERKSRELWSAVAGVAALVSVGCLLALQALAIGELEAATERAIDAGASLRSTALSAAARRSEADLWASVSDSKPNVRTPDKVLVRMADLSREMPGDAFWTKVDWTPDQIVMEGVARDAVSMLARMSALNGLTARFSKPVTPLPEGRQKFEITLSPSSPSVGSAVLP